MEKTAKLLIAICLMLILSKCGSKTDTKNENETKISIADTFNLQILDSTTVEIKKFKIADILPYYKNHKWGYANKNGELIIPALYDACGFFSDNIAWVQQDGKYGFIDSTGYIKIPCKYDDASDFKSGIIPVKKVNYWGFINKLDETVIPFSYEDIYFNDDNYYHIKQNKQWGTLSKDGKQIIMPIYSNDFYFEDSLAIVKRNNKFGLIDNKGVEKIECKYDEIIPAGKNSFIVKKKIRYNYYTCGLADTSGKVIIPLIYTNIKSINGLALIVKNETSTGILSHTNDTIIDFKYQEIRSGNTNLLAAHGNNWGFININGDTIIQFNYVDAKAFYNNLAVVKQIDSYGMINQKGNIIIPCNYEKIENEKDEIIKVYNKVEKHSSKQMKYGFYSRSGTMINPCIYDDHNYSHHINHDSSDDEILFGKFINGCAIVGINGRIGVINKKCETIVPLNYHWMTQPDQNGISIVSYRGKKGLVHKSGKQLTHLKYDKIERDYNSGYYYTFSKEPSYRERNRNRYHNTGYFNLDGTHYSTYYDSTLISQSKEEEIIVSIRKSYESIKADLKNEEKETINISSKIKGVKTNNTLKIIYIDKNLTYDYFYNDTLNNHGPFFILKTDKNGDKPIYDRYYFKNTRIIRHVNPTGEKQLISDAIFSPEHEEHFRAREMKVKFENAMTLKNIDQNKLKNKVEELKNKIDNNISNGVYKKGDSKSEEEGEYSLTEDVYYDNKGKQIYYFYSTSAEGSLTDKIEYYWKGQLIYSSESSSNDLEFIDHGIDKQWNIVSESTTIYSYNDHEISYHTYEYAIDNYGDKNGGITEIRAY